MQAGTLAPTTLFQKTVRYEIPEFQRPYVWTQDQQWEPLWEDVRNTAEDYLDDGKDAPHFMGAIVLQQQPNSALSFETHIVVDGQQRLTTIQLLLDAVQESLEERRHQNPAERLRYLVTNPPVFTHGDPDKVFKVWPTINDQDSFRHAMRNDLSSDEHRESNIVKAHNFFRTQVDLWLDRRCEPGADPAEAAKAAGALERAVSSLLELVVIALAPADAPHIIFETLNARGTPLLQAEMIKNRILYEAHAEGGAPDAGALWGFDSDWWRDEVGRGYLRRPRIDVFLNNWLAMRRVSAIGSNEEFESFKGYFREKKGAGESIADVATDIGRIGKIYEDLERRRIPAIDTFLRRREVMQVGVLTPVLLSLFASDVPQAQREKGLRAVESYLVRRMVCGMSTRNYGKLFIGLLGELVQSADAEAGDTIVRYLRSQRAHANVWPDDRMLENAFLTAPLYWSLTRGRLRLVLEGIEAKLRTEMAETADAPRNLTIEHVMPQSWRQFWPLPADVEEPGAPPVAKPAVTTTKTGRPPYIPADSWGSFKKAVANGNPDVISKRLRTLNNHRRRYNKPDLTLEEALAYSTPPKPPVAEPGGDSQPAPPVAKDNVDRDRIIQSIGNLTLVNERLNTILSNGPWESKRKGLGEHSVLFLNKDLLDKAPATWDEAAIADRARRLCQAAIKVWPHADGIQ